MSRQFAWANGILQSVATTGNVKISLSGQLAPTNVTWQGAVIGTLDYSWGSSTRLNGLTINGSSGINYAYNEDGQLIQANEMSSTHNLDNGFVSSTSAGAVETSHVFNAYGEESQTNIFKNGTSLINFQYTRDALGRITSISKNVSGSVKTSSFSYDSIGQLKSETVNGITSNYTYTNNGNRITSGGAELYDTHDRLTSNSNWKFTYNRNGFLSRKDHISNGTWSTYAYDALGNLLSVSNSLGSKVDYLADGLDRRVRKNINGQFSLALIYQDKYRPVAQLNSNGSIKSIFVYGNKVNIPDTMQQGLNTYRIVSDHLGSPLYVINISNGQIVQQMTYDSWGNVLSDSNPGFQPFGFAGGIYDQSTKLLKFGARDYDPSIARWLNKDPTGFEGGINLYTYAYNNPLNFIDVNGQRPKTPFPKLDIMYDEMGVRMLQDPDDNFAKYFKEFDKVSGVKIIVVSDKEFYRYPNRAGANAWCRPDRTIEIRDAILKEDTNDADAQSLLMHEMLHIIQLARGEDINDERKHKFIKKETIRYYEKFK